MKMKVVQLLVDKKITNSREKAKEMILNKLILIDGKFIIKPSTIVSSDSNIKILAKLKYVSRGGLKLEKALDQFKVDVDNLVCLDIGSSTGGFTDCLLQKNAKLIYALDVGTNQLAWSIRSNPKVISMEKTNFRYSKKEDFLNQIEFAVCDVSFISLDKILPPLFNILQIDGFAILLIKPQFEAGKLDNKNGKIINEKVHKKVLMKILNDLIDNNFLFKNLSYSPIKGNKKGNIEYLIYIQKKISLNNDEKNPEEYTDLINSTVLDAWINLK